MDRKGFEQIVREYSKPLYWHIRRFVYNHDDANDVLQNTFLKAWTNFEKFQGDAKISTWLTRIAINESIDFLRHKKFVASKTGGDLSVADMLMADPYFDGSESEAKFHEAVAALPDVQRTVFQLRYFDNMKFSEIGEILNTSEGAIKSSYHIAERKIIDFFKGSD